MSDSLGPAPVPAEPTPTVPRRPMLAGLDRSRLPGAATALGVALVAAAVMLSATHSREHGDLDGSNFTMGVLATLGLLGIAVAVQILLPDAEPRAQLASWPGAAGALAAGVMLMVLINHDWSAYVGSVVVIALSMIGYLLTRSAPFVLSTIAGLALLYAKAFDDIFDLDGDGNNTFMAIGAGVLVFVVAVTVAGWALPATRVLSGVVVGVGGLAAMVVVLTTVTAFRVITTAFSVPVPSPADSSDGNAYSSELHLVRHDPFKNDVWMILLYCALLALLWASAALATGHVGFRVLLLADGVVIIPLAAYALLASHPTWWEVVSAGVGGLVLLGVGWQAWQQRPPTAPPTAPPPETAPAPGA